MNAQGGRAAFILHPSSLVLAAAVLLLAACGFQLRGTAELPFESLYIQAPATAPLTVQIRRAIQAGSATRVTDRPEEAEVVLQIMNELQEKQILSLGGGGRVREFQLRYRVSFRLTDRQNRELIPLSEILMSRDYSYNDEEALAKEGEEALLFRDMRSDAIQQLVRRLQAVRIGS